MAERFNPEKIILDTLAYTKPGEAANDNAVKAINPEKKIMETAIADWKELLKGKPLEILAQEELEKPVHQAGDYLFIDMNTDLYGPVINTPHNLRAAESIVKDSDGVCQLFKYHKSEDGVVTQR